MHIKRKTIPLLWPIPRTGTKYLALPMHNQITAVPLVIVMREILKLVKNKKELKKILNEKKIVVNAKIVKELTYPLGIFDTLAIPSIKKFYRAGLNGKKLVLEEISEKESSIRVYKIIGKTILKSKKVQLNLSDGRNMISDKKYNVGDFLEIDNSNNKILKEIPLKENVEVLAIKGKHIGKKGKIKEIIKEGGNIIARISSDDEEIKASVENLFAIA